MIFRVFLPFAAFLPLAAADVTGHWNFDGDVSGNAIHLECSLKQAGAKLEGTCKTAESDIKLAGEVNEPKVRFSYAVNQRAPLTLCITPARSTPLPK